MQPTKDAPPPSKKGHCCNLEKDASSEYRCYYLHGGQHDLEKDQPLLPSLCGSMTHMPSIHILSARSKRGKGFEVMSLVYIEVNRVWVLGQKRRDRFGPKD